MGFRFLPAVRPPLSPYLASQNQFGNTAARPGPLFLPAYPLEPYVQGPKYWLSEYGLDYSLQFTPTLRLQPDFQFVTNPAFNRDHDHAMVLQLQLSRAS